LGTDWSGSALEIVVPAQGKPYCAAALRSEEHTSNSSHANISYAVFCLKKKNKKKPNNHAGHRHALFARRRGAAHRRCRGPPATATAGGLVPETGTVRWICFFFFNDRAPPEIYPLSLPDALPI